jgi:RES domain-containing protein
MPEPSERLLWRAYVPRWAYQPLSGEGAARFGGRWNRIGRPTVYAACELSTAWAEYNQGFVQHPAIILQLKLTDARLVDLTDPAVLAAYGLDARIHAEEWRDAMQRGDTPQTHMLADRLIEQGAHGLIYPSFMSPGGRCAALWQWNTPDGPRLEATDPEGRLPKSPASWTEPGQT